MKEFKRGDIVRVWNKEIGKSVWGIILSASEKTVLVDSIVLGGEKHIQYKNVRYPNENETPKPFLTVKAHKIKHSQM